MNINAFNKKHLTNIDIFYLTKNSANFKIRIHESNEKKRKKKNRNSKGTLGCENVAC